MAEDDPGRGARRRARWRPAHYRFACRWELPAAPERVYEALADPLRYPAWWPQVREARQTGDREGELRFRSLLPFDLRVHVRGRREDPVARVLEAELAGDLEGRVRWTVTPRGDRSAVAVFEQEVEVRHRLVRALSPLCRPAFRLNHALMMRQGRAGLRAYLGPAR